MTKAKRKIKSKTRLAILAGQKIAQATGVAATVLIFGTLGGIESGMDMLKGIAVLAASGGVLAFSVAVYRVLDDALFWEHRRRMERKERMTRAATHRSCTRKTNQLYFKSFKEEKQWQKQNLR